MWTDKAMTKLTVTFHNFEKVSLEVKYRAAILLS
jgi:hypothetical protein